MRVRETHIPYTRRFDVVSFFIGAIATAIFIGVAAVLIAVFL
ncbi:MAG TPA: hypothetical protein VGI56_12450 [Galbitalea sp.]|jgi:hypothetical protein